MFLVIVNLWAKMVNRGAFIDQELFQQQGPLFMGEYWGRDDKRPGHIKTIIFHNNMCVGEWGLPLAVFLQ